MQRRQFLQSSLLLGATLPSLVACIGSDGASDASVQPPPPGGGGTPSSREVDALLATNAFPYGVASGDPDADKLILWTALKPLNADVASIPLRLEYVLSAQRLAKESDWAALFTTTAVRTLGTFLALKARDYTVKIDVDGLEAGQLYYYWFTAGQASSPAGVTRTLPAGGMADYRMAVVSCSNFPFGYFNAYREIAKRGQTSVIDAVIHLGDYIYEYASAANPVRIPTGGWVTSLSDYRNRYALHKSEKSLQAMHAQCPWLVTWDDHEVSNDYAGLVRGFSGNITLDFEAQRAQAYQAFYEHMPLRASALTRSIEGLARGAEMRIYGQVAFGKLANIYLLDDRQYRDRQVCNKGLNFGSGWVDPEQCEAWLNPSRTLLGPQQEQWLNQSFSTARSDQRVWNVVAQQTLFGRREYKLGAGLSLWNDGWDGYSAARQRMTQSMQTHALKNPVLIGGDVHENWVGHVMADAYKDDSAKLGVEFCGAGITARSAGNSKLPARLAENPHFIFADSERKGYGDRKSVV